VYLSIRLSVCLTATITKRKKTKKKRTWTTTIATACRFVHGNTEARILIKLETRSDGRKEGINRETKAPKKKLRTQFSFYSRLWDRSQIFIYTSKGNPKKKSLKRNRLSNHIKCPQNTHTPQIHPLSSNATTTRNTREENAQETATERGKRERRSDRHRAMKCRPLYHRLATACPHSE
jgi:hypothetical protein